MKEKLDKLVREEWLWDYDLQDDELTINVELTEYEQKLYEEMKLSKQMKQTYDDLDSVIVQDILRNTFKK